jgi:hypothetical protein
MDSRGSEEGGKCIKFQIKMPLERIYTKWLSVTDERYGSADFECIDNIKFE